MITFLLDHKNIVLTAIFTVTALMILRLTGPSFRQGQSYRTLFQRRALISNREIAILVGIVCVPIHLYLFDHLDVVGLVLAAVGVAAVCMLYLKQGTILWPQTATSDTKGTPAWRLWLIWMAAQIF